MVIPELPRSLRGCSANPSRLEEGPAVLTTETAATAEPNADTNLLNLLIVDDERSVRESCREVGCRTGVQHPDCGLARTCLSHPG